MSIRKEIEILKDPMNIREAVFASSAKVLTFAFESDPHVLFLIRAGRSAVQPIADEIRKHGAKLNDITVSCYVYILQKIDAKATVDLLSPILPKIVDRRAFFAPTFITHALRLGMGLPVKEQVYYYTHAEFSEAVQAAKLRRRH